MKAGGYFVILLIVIAVIGGFASGTIKIPGSTTSTTVTTPPQNCSSSTTPAGTACVPTTSSWKLSFFNALNGTEFSATNTRYEIRNLYGGTIDGESYTAGGKTTTQANWYSGTAYVLRLCSSVSALTSCNTPFTADETVQDIPVSVPYLAPNYICTTAPCFTSTFFLTAMTSTKGTSVFSLQSVAALGSVLTTFETVAEGSYTSGDVCPGTTVGIPASGTCFILTANTQTPLVLTFINANTVSPNGDSGYPGTFGVYGSPNGLANGSPLGMYVDIRMQAGSSGSCSATACNSTNIGQILNSVLTGPNLQGSVIKETTSATDQSWLVQLQDYALNFKAKNPNPSLPGSVNGLFAGSTQVGFTYDNTGQTTAKGTVFVNVMIKVYLNVAYFVSGNANNNNAEAVNSVLTGFSLKRAS